MPSSVELEKELERAVLKTETEVTNLQNMKNREFERVMEAVKNCESEAEAQKFHKNFHEFNQRIINEMNDFMKKGQAEKEIENQRKRERAQELRKIQEKGDEVVRRKWEEAEREARELERIRRETARAGLNIGDKDEGPQLLEVLTTAFNR